MVVTVVSLFDLVKLGVKVEGPGSLPTPPVNFELKSVQRIRPFSGTHSFVLNSASTNHWFGSQVLVATLYH